MLYMKLFAVPMFYAYCFILYQTTASYRLQSAAMSFVLWIWMLNKVIVQGIFSALSLGKFNVKIIKCIHCNTLWSDYWDGNTNSW